MAVQFKVGPIPTEGSDGAEGRESTSGSSPASPEQDEIIAVEGGGWTLLETNADARPQGPGWAW